VVCVTKEWESPVTASEINRSMKSILLVEDDLELCLLMKDYFAQQGFRIDAVHDGRTGLRG